MKPPSWYSQHQDRQAASLRDFLAGLNLYHTRDISKDESHDQYEVNLRAKLPQLINQLDRNDLAAIYQAIELLVYCKRPNAFLEAYGTHHRLIGERLTSQALATA